MKKLLLVLIAFSSILTYSQCTLNANFTFSTSGGTVSFTNTSTNEPVIPFYQWDYDGQSSTLENPSFPQAATDEYACFTVYDSTWTCTDSLCILIPGDSSACNLNISWTQSISGGNITFTNTSTGVPTPANYAWLYDGQAQNIENPTFPYNPSITQVCFAIDDLSGGTCSDSICGPVYPDSTGCNLVVDFTMTIDSGYVYFTNTSTGEPLGANYNWWYGGQSSSAENPVFMLDSANSYACLTVFDSSWNCYDSTCFLIDPATANINDEVPFLDATIYPNPVLNELFVRVNSGHEISFIEIYDASGTLVYSESSSNMDSAIQIDVNELNSGVYIINIQGVDDNIRFTERFLKR